MYNLSIDCYERAVRTEDTRRDTDILECYLMLGLAQARQQKTDQQSRYVYWRVVNTLEETICDSLLSFHWRKKVYAKLKQFKAVMYEILSEKEYNAFTYRLRLHAEYFLDFTDYNEASSKLAAALEKLEKKSVDE